MSSRRIKLKANESVAKCPKCGNNTDFTIYSDYCAEDCCEVWAECKCGYNPTANDTSNRLEDVWGGCDDNNCLDAIRFSWTDVIEESEVSNG